MSGDLSLEAEDRILVAVGKVEKKVDTLTDRFTKNQIETAVAIAKIQQAEAACPIREVEDAVREMRTNAEADRRAQRRLTTMIATAISGAGAAIATALGWKGGGG